MRMGNWSVGLMSANASIVSILSVLALSLIALPSQAFAQDKKEVRELSRTQEAKLRAEGEPRDRCTLGANIYDGPVVSRATPNSSLRPGDRIALLNRTNVSGRSADEVIAMLRDIPPTATVALTIDRGGELLDIDAQCFNARPYHETLLSALSLAARGKFDECVDVVSQIQDVDTRSLTVKTQCTSVASKSKQANAPSLLAELLAMAIQDATYAPGLRPDVVKGLRNVEGQITQSLGAGRFQALVESTKRWPGGERLFEESAPDWALFRRNAETALRSRLIDPDSGRIEWTHGFQLGTWRPFLSKPIDGYWSCGLINARNRMGGYTGSTAFVVVLDPTGYVKYSQMGESRDFDVVTASCNNSLKYLPPAPPELLANKNEGGPAGSSSPSLADELQKLVDLRNSGALTEPEFQAAKQRLLGSPSK